MYSPVTPRIAAEALPADRALFIRRVYGHLAAAIALFIFVEVIVLHTPLSYRMVQFLAEGGKFGWLLFLGGFILLGWLARGLASKTESVPLQYTGLGLYIVAEALIFAPLLLIASIFAPDTILMAAMLTSLLFVGLSVAVFTTRKDFSFLGSILSIGGIVALGVIVGGAIFGFTLGLFFSGAMVLLACGAILYDTSNVLHHYPTHQYVGASLELFASIALLFWYILNILLELRR